MIQRHTERRFGLLPRYFSQQETISVPATSHLSISLDKVNKQANTAYADPNTLGLALHRAIPTNLDLTVYQAIPTTSHPLLDRAIPTTPYPLLDQKLHIMPDIGKDQVVASATYKNKKHILRIVAVVIVLTLFIAVYIIWHIISYLPVVTQQNFGVTAPKISASKSGTPTKITANSIGDIQVYIIGAVQHPGIYTLPANARVYQLLQAAGGPSSNANLVALNLAAKLNDGQEIYVTALGESLPLAINSLSSITPSSSSASSSQNQPLVNINTASADELRQQLQISSKTAQAIVSYHQQHGPFTSVDQLLQVVSQSIYDKIKNKVAV